MSVESGGADVETEREGVVGEDVCVEVELVELGTKLILVEGVAWETGVDVVVGLVEAGGPEPP